MTAVHSQSTTLPGAPAPQPSEIIVVVSARTTAAEGIIVLALEPVGGVMLPPWTPGAHIDLVLDNGLVRQYSLCGDPADRDRYLVSVLLEPNGGGGSRYIHDNLALGSSLTIRGPRNHFKMVAAERYIFIAGGIGITPILPMLRQATSSGKPWQLYYTGRSLRTMPFREELAEYGQSVSVAAKDEGQRLNLVEILAPSDGDVAVYCCGPERLSTGAIETCESSWPAGSVHVEHFVPKEIDNSLNTTFTLQLERSGLTLQVPPGKSVLEVMESAGVHIPCSCAAGTCGTCEVDVLEGEPEHRDSVLTDEERADNLSMMVCVSRSKTPRLVLDA